MASTYVTHITWAGESNVKKARLHSLDMLKYKICRPELFVGLPVRWSPAIWPMSPPLTPYAGTTSSVSKFHMNALVFTAFRKLRTETLPCYGSCLFYRLFYFQLTSAWMRKSLLANILWDSVVKRFWVGKTVQSSHAMVTVVWLNDRKSRKIQRSGKVFTVPVHH